MPNYSGCRPYHFRVGIKKEQTVRFMFTPKVAILMLPIAGFLADASGNVNGIPGGLITLAVGAFFTLLSGYFYYRASQWGDSRYTRKEDHEKEIKRIEEQSGRDYKHWEKELGRVEDLNATTQDNVKALAEAVERQEAGTRQVMHELRNTVNQHFLNFTETLGKLQGQMEALISLRRRNNQDGDN